MEKRGKVPKWQTETWKIDGMVWAFFKVLFAVIVDLSKGREEQTMAKCEKSWERHRIDVDTDSHPPGDGVFINAGFPRRRFWFPRGEGERGRERSAGALNPSPRSGLHYHNSEPMAIYAQLLRSALAGGQRRWKREIAGSGHRMLRNARKKSICHETYLMNVHLRCDVEIQSSDFFFFSI